MYMISDWDLHGVISLTSAPSHENQLYIFIFYIYFNQWLLLLSMMLDYLEECLVLIYVFSGVLKLDNRLLVLDLHVYNYEFKRNV